MTPLEIEFIEETIGSEQKQFYYFRDKYALQLLQYHVKESIRINELKNSRFGNLLDKKPIREVLKGCGSGWLESIALNNYVTEEGRNFNYSISKWGEFKAHRNDTWFQTSRPGLNLVLQLNFDSWHNHLYHKLIKKGDEYDPFKFYSHPIATKGNHTMAWCRMDINLDSGEVLIEEIQNDWLREVRNLTMDMTRILEKSKEETSSHWFFSDYSISDFKKYNALIEDYQRMWAEAMLSLSIHFLKEEIGLNTIYYHEFESGNILKHLECSKPPKSLYTTLPKKFGFEKTSTAPNFLLKEKYLRKKLSNNDLKWWVLNI